ncbi:MAG: hypothetical protein K0V04_37335, partial [Deltaproteobacteria bacterium]|nr:hypothetical protein [Deltaproteobacteria bacterium]
SGTDTSGGTGTDTEDFEILEDDDPVATPSSSPSSPSSPSSRPSRPRKPPRNKPKSEPKAPPPKDDKPDPAKLLKQARTAYIGGRGSTAYTLASRSYSLSKTQDAAELMTMAACLLNNGSKARDGLRKVALFKRGSIRSRCKSKHGFRIPL